MNFDEIESTAAHEVTHLFEEKHNSRFESKQADINSSLWEPSAGMMGALPEGYKPKKTKIDKRKLRPIKSRCNYHLCKKRAKTYKCKFCRKYFCSKHKTPRPPSLPLFKDTSQIAKMLMEEFHKDNAHPCFPYLHFWERQKQEERDAWGRTLDILSGKSSKNKSFVEVDTKDLDLIPDLKDLDKELKKDRKFFNKNQDINKLAIKRLKENKEEESEKKESKVWKTIKDYFKGFSF